MKENIPVLLVSFLPKTNEHDEKIVLEIKQRKKNEIELLNARWFKVGLIGELDRMILSLLKCYVVSKLYMGEKIHNIMYMLNDMVYRALKYGNEIGIEYLKKRLVEIEEERT